MKFLVICAVLTACLNCIANEPPMLGAPEPAGILVEFKADDANPSINLRGILTLPETTKGPVPVVFMIWGSTCDNGTGWVPATDTATGKDEGIFTDIRNAFIKRGIGVFTYTKRGCSPEHGGTGDKAIRATATRSNLLADAKAAFMAFQKNAAVDPARVFVLGYSEGNTYAWELGLIHGEKIKGLLMMSMVSGRYVAAEYFQAVLRRMDAFNLVDENHDGKITKADINKYACFQLKDYFNFEKCDLDKDGVLTALEFRSCRERRWIEFMSNIDSTPTGQFVEDSKDPAEWYREHLKAKSMIETTSQQKVTIAIFEGDRDTATPVFEAVALRDALRLIGKPPIFFKIYPGLSHGWAKGTGRGGHCEKFGPVEPHVLSDLVSVVQNSITKAK